MNAIDIGIFSNLFFNGYVLFKEPFEFYITYLPIVLLLPVFFFRYRFPRELLYILIPLAITGILNVVLGNNEFKNFFKIFANIALNLVFYRYVIEYYEYDTIRMFKMYMKGCFFVAVVGFVQWLGWWAKINQIYNWGRVLSLNKWGHIVGGLGIRVNSTFSEPSGLGLSLGPACFICIYTLMKGATEFISKPKAILILIVYLLTFSSLAYLGIFLSIILLAVNFGLVRYVLIAVPVTIILFTVAYKQAKEFRVRVDGLTALFVDDILSKNKDKSKNYRIRHILEHVHGSSFVLYNSFHVAGENFKNNPLFGSGLGSHEIAFDKYNLNSILGGIYKFNTADANSMLLRITSELGIMGLLFTFFFIFKFYVSKSLNGDEDDHYWLLSNALLVLILIQLFRQGNYTFTGFMFYAWMYYFNRNQYLEYKEQLSQKREEAQVEEKYLSRVPQSL